jgi:hypothetical protein
LARRPLCCFSSEAEVAADAVRAIASTRKEQRAMLFGLVDERHVSPLGQPGPLAT